MEETLMTHAHTRVYSHTHTNTLPPTAPKTPPGGKVHVQLLSRPILWMLLQEKEKEPHTGNKTHSPPQSLQIHEGTSYRTWRSRYPQQAALPKQTSRTKRDQPVLAPGPDPETKDGWMYGWMVGWKDGWMEMKEEWQQQRRRQILPPHEDAGEQMESNRRQKKMKQMKVWPCGSAGPGFCWSGSYCPRVERASFPIMRQPAFFFLPLRNSRAELAFHLPSKLSHHSGSQSPPSATPPPNTGWWQGSNAACRLANGASSQGWLREEKEEA